MTIPIVFPFNPLVEDDTGWRSVVAQLKKIFDSWAKFLHSAKVLHKGEGGWLSAEGFDVLKVPVYNDPNRSVSFYDAFKHDNQAKNDPYYGFTCWDDFFTREFKSDGEETIHMSSSPLAKAVSSQWTLFG